MRPASDLRADGSDASSGAGARRHLGLDGLRGLAVAWVVLFHLWPDVVPGGWLGVGLFFTLSGYLVVGLIDAEVSATGRLRLGRFMARRVRRLMPAALLTIASVLALTAALDDQALREVGFDALTAVLNVFNWRTALDTAGYAAIFEARPEPLAHFWSLAIEEQFYLLFPTAAALTRRTALVVWAMLIAGLVGVVLWWGSADAYVATPVRALEIAAGAGLALAAARSGFVQRLMNPDADQVRGRAKVIAEGLIFAVAVGVTVVALLGLGPQDSLVFRGGPQLMALCWVVFVVAAVRDGIPAQIMSAGVLRWLGTRSYAIYLFHWPLIELTDWHPVAVIAATLIAAEASFRLIEMPVRRGTGHRALILLGCAALAVALGASSMTVLSTPARAVGERAAGVDELPAWALESLQDSDTGPTGVPTPLTSAEAPDALDATDTQTTQTDTATTTSLVTEPPPTTDSPTVKEVPFVTVIGDSTGLSIADGLRRWADANRTMAVVDRTQAGCYPLRDKVPGSVWRVDQHANSIYGLPPAREACQENHIEPNSDLVLVVHHGTALFERHHADGAWLSILDEEFAMGVREFYRNLVNEVRALDAQVIFTNAPRLLPYYRESPEPDPKRAEIYNSRAEIYNSLLHALVAEFDSPNRPTDVWLVDTASGLNASGFEGTYSRTDGIHLDLEGSELFAAEILGPAILEILASGPVG